MATNYGLARGTLTQTAFDANSDYLLTNWQGFAGAGSIEFAADNEATVQKYFDKKRLLGGGHGAVGTWKVPPWRILINRTMASYIETTIFQGEVSTDVTFSHFDTYTNTWYIFNAKATFSRLVDDNITTRNNEWIPDYTIEFDKIRVADVS